MHALERERLGGVWWRYARARWAVGDVETAEPAATRALRLLPPRGLSVADALLTAGLIAAQRGALTTADRRYLRGLRALEDDDSPAAKSRRAGLLLARGDVLLTRGRPEGCLAAADKALEIGLAAGIRVTVAHAHHYAATALRVLGRPATDRARAALEIFAEVGEPRTLAIGENTLGLCLLADGNVNAAAAAYQRAADLLDRSGAAVAAAVIANNVGDLLLSQGRWTESADTLRPAAATLAAARHPYAGLLWANLVEAELGRADLAAAEAALVVAQSHFTESVYDANVHAAAAEVALRKGRPDEADAAVERLLAAPSPAASRSTAARLHGLAAWARGDAAGAGAALRDAVAAAASVNDRMVEVRALNALCAVCPTPAAAERLQELRDELEIVDFLPVPPVGEPL